MMNSYKHKRVLLADEMRQRARAIEKTLQRYWKASVQLVSSSAEAFLASKKADEIGSRFDVIMIAFGFGGFKHTEIFQGLAKAGQKSVLVDSVLDRPLPTAVDSLLIVPDNAVVGDSRLIENLSSVMGNRPPKLPNLSNSASLDNTLRFQVQWLDPQGDLAKGNVILRQLVYQALPNMDSFTLYRIRQGLSGARVFRISCSGSGGKSDFVLKLTPREEDWKCEHEVKSCHEIQKYFRKSIIPLVPKVYTSSVSRATKTPPARSSNWTAVLYTFLGGDTPVADFERVFFDPNGCLSDLDLKGSKPPPGVDQTNLSKFFLNKLFEELAKLYKRGVTIVRKPLWSSSEPQKQGSLTFPPYCFTAWEKCRVAESIQQLERYGYSIKRARWRKTRDLVLACLPKKDKITTKLQALLKRRLVLLTHVHGDLNANNALMSLNFGLPFLIDLACFQSEGHIVQDFARLEVAIKIELMGREKDNTLEGLDLNSHTFGKWCSAEDWLHGWPQDDTLLGSLLHDETSIVRAYSLCRHIRSLARQVHYDTLLEHNRRASFTLSYNAALLYHTIRAIRYDSLPHLKRIFAAYCAGRTLEQLQP